jgi:hypothetical protein
MALAPALLFGILLATGAHAALYQAPTSAILNKKYDYIIVGGAVFVSIVATFYFYFYRTSCIQAELPVLFLDVGYPRLRQSRCWLLKPDQGMCILFGELIAGLRLKLCGQRLFEYGNTHRGGRWPAGRVAICGLRDLRQE